VGLATAIKLVPGVFIVYLWLSGRRRAAVTAAAAALAWTLGAWLLLPGDSVTYWTSAIFQSGRLGSNAGTSNQSLRGALLRVFLPGQAPGALWAAVAVLVAVAGFAVARRLARQDREMEGIAVTALLAALLSPVSWIHHFLAVVVVIGAILADGRSRRRIAIAAGTAAFFALTVPWWGRSLLSQPDVPALAWTLGAWLLLPGDSVTYWTSAIFQSGRLGSNAGTSNQSLRGVLLRLFLPGQAAGVLWAAETGGWVGRSSTCIKRASRERNISSQARS